MVTLQLEADVNPGCWCCLGTTGVMGTRNLHLGCDGGPNLSYDAVPRPWLQWGPQAWLWLRAGITGGLNPAAPTWPPLCPMARIRLLRFPQPLGPFCQCQAGMGKPRVAAAPGR